MNEFKDYLKELITSARDEEDKNPDDYIGPDGLMYCGECRTKKQHKVTIFGKERIVPVLCACRAEEREKEMEEIERREKIDAIRKAKNACIHDKALINCTFENDDGSLPLIASARKYVETWPKRKENNNGLLLWGDVGTGKSFYAACIQICIHADIEDEDQSVHYPEIHTTAKDSVTEDEQAVVSEETTIVDTVAYHNLIPGETYVLKGSLMDKSTKKVISIDGAELTAEKTFIPEAADGSTDIVFTFPAETLQGTTTVVFEKLYNAEINVVSHEDFKDEGQTVYIPSVKTTAKDRDTQSRSGSVKKSAVVEDIVNYTNLIVGREYTVKGVLMNKETGEEILQDGKKITAEKTFKAEKSAGNVTLTFAVDSTLLEGKNVVVFEDLYRENIRLVSHADIEDEDQTVHYPKIRTSAAIGGSKTVTADSFVTLTDVVTFENLIPGETYSLQGVLMNAETGSEFSVHGNSVRETVTFIPEKADGTTEVTFRFDAEGLGGGSIVVFEKLFHNGKEIARHEDLEDKDQTVRFTTPPAPPSNPPKTGDANDMALPAVVMIAAGAVLVVLLYRRKRFNH